MKRFLVVLFSVISFMVYAQTPTKDDPVIWEFSHKQVSNTQVDIQFVAFIFDGDHLYSQDTTNIVPTSFTFDESKSYNKIGAVSEEDPTSGYDNQFDMVTKYFEHKTTFKQRIEILKDDKIDVKGSIDYIACNEERCYFPLGPKEFSLNIQLVDNFENNVLGCMDPNATNYDSTSTLDDGSCFLEGCMDLTASNYNPDATKQAHYSCKYPQAELEKIKTSNNNIYDDPLVDLENPAANCGADNKEKDSNSLWWIFFLGISGGLLALVTPCVFPMIPLTVSFFTKGKSEKGIFNATMYGFFIMLIYFLLSIPFHVMPNIDPAILNQISTNTWLNLMFFVIFIAFAFSFFGYYELTLPSKWGNKADSGSNIGGLIGIFFMALTLAIVSFSCTGPILGTLLAGTLGGDVSTVALLGIEFKMVATKLTIGMTGFGLALGLPFALFALFPKILNALPQSGGWLNSVKVVLGFLEVALAIKFLSNADMVEQWGLIKRETYFFLWFVVGVLTVLYLIGKIKFPHDAPIKKISKIRYSFIVFFTAFTIYLIPGMFGSHLNWWEHKLLSGFPPPLSYSYTYTEKEEIFHDYWEAIEYSKKVNKPIFIDFTGWNCTNCRDMEENVFPEVQELLDQYVICKLYVDEKTKLKEPDIVFKSTTEGIQKVILKTIGNKWSILKTITYDTEELPYYILYSGKDGLLAHRGKTKDIEEFEKWLECGLEAYEKEE